jgi:hypothetical protein
VRTAEAMLAGGFTQADVDTVLWDNPVAFYGQSGRLELDSVLADGPAADGSAADGMATFAGNSIRRGGE